MTVLLLIAPLPERAFDGYDLPLGLRAGTIGKVAPEAVVAFGV